MGAFITTEGDKEKKIDVKRRGEGDLSHLSPLKVESFLEDDTL